MHSSISIFVPILWTPGMCLFICYHIFLLISLVYTHAIPLSYIEYKDSRVHTVDPRHVFILSLSLSLARSLSLGRARALSLSLPFTPGMCLYTRAHTHTLSLARGRSLCVRENVFCQIESVLFRCFFFEGFTQNVCSPKKECVLSR